MTLKKEIGKIEEEEELGEYNRRLSEIEKNVFGLYHRIAVIVEYIDRETRKEEPTTEEQEIETIRAKARELRSLALDLKIKDITKILKEQKNEKERTNSEYVKGYEDGAKALSEKMGNSTDQAKEKTEEKKIGLGLGHKIGDV